MYKILFFRTLQIFRDVPGKKTIWWRSEFTIYIIPDMEHLPWPVTNICFWWHPDIPRILGSQVKNTFLVKIVCQILKFWRNTELLKKIWFSEIIGHPGQEVVPILEIVNCTRIDLSIQFVAFYDPFYLPRGFLLDKDSITLEENERLVLKGMLLFAKILPVFLHTRVS